MSRDFDDNEKPQEREFEDIPYPTEIADGVRSQHVGRMVSLFFYQEKVSLEKSYKTPEKRHYDESVKKRILYEVRMQDEIALDQLADVCESIRNTFLQRRQIAHEKSETVLAGTAWYFAPWLEEYTKAGETQAITEIADLIIRHEGELREKLKEHRK